MKSLIAVIAIALALVGSALAQDQPQPARGTNDAPVIAGIYYQSPTGYVSYGAGHKFWIQNQRDA